MTKHTTAHGATWEIDDEGDVRIEPPGEEPTWLSRDDVKSMTVALVMRDLLPLPMCGHVTNGMGPCVRRKDHEQHLHLNEDGTEFSHSGKIGLGQWGRMGVAFAGSNGGVVSRPPAPDSTGLVPPPPPAKYNVPTTLPGYDERGRVQHPWPPPAQRTALRTIRVLLFGR